MRKFLLVMKKIKMLLLAVIMACPVWLKAEPIAIDTSYGQFILPFQVVSGTELYSFDLGKGFPALETVLWRDGNFEFTFGAAAVLGANTNVPFLALQGRLSPNIFDIGDNELKFGLWVGQPSHWLDENKGWEWGIKTSIPLW